MRTCDVARLFLSFAVEPGVLDSVTRQRSEHLEFVDLLGIAGEIDKETWRNLRPCRGNRQRDLEKSPVQELVAVGHEI